MEQKAMMRRLMLTALAIMMAMLPIVSGMVYDDRLYVAGKQSTYEHQVYNGLVYDENVGDYVQNYTCEQTYSEAVLCIDLNTYEVTEVFRADDVVHAHNFGFYADEKAAYVYMCSLWTERIQVHPQPHRKMTLQMMTYSRRISRTLKATKTANRNHTDKNVQNKSFIIPGDSEALINYFMQNYCSTISASTAFFLTLSIPFMQPERAL